MNWPRGGAGRKAAIKKGGFDTDDTDCTEAAGIAHCADDYLRTVQKAFAFVVRVES